MTTKKKQNKVSGVRKEITASTDFISAMLEKYSTPKPDNEIQGLMEAYPLEEPESTTEELQVLRELVVDCIDALQEKQILVINAIMFEQITFQELAKRMGYKSKETARRHFAIAMDDLKVIMFANKELMERFKDE
jgi:DNA-directed RNA polymerase specialized sigma24 family protein